MGSAIIAEVPIVDCRASVEVVFLHITQKKPETGFSYIFNGQVSAAALQQKRATASKLPGLSAANAPLRA